MFEQLKRQFLASFAAKIDSLKAALESQNTQALTVQVHQLCGSSGSYGFDHIANLCADIESEAIDLNRINESMIDKTEQLIDLMEQHLNATV